MPPVSATISVGANTTQFERDILNSLNRVQAPLGRISVSADEFSKSLAASNARVIAFGASAGLVLGLERAFADLLKTSTAVQKSLQDINVILNASDSSLEKFSNSLFDIAKNTGQAFKSVAAAATELSRQGLGVQEILKRTNDALILSRLTGLDAAEAVQDLTASVNTFNKVGLDSTTIINKLANVDAKFSVSARDLAEGIKRVGSTAADTGVNIESLLGLITLVQQSTSRGGAVIGNALKTIFTRLERPETLDLLDDFKVKVRDAQGEALSADTILINLAKTFDKLSSAEQNHVIQLSAGVFQSNVFRTILRDLSKETTIYKGAVDAASQSTQTAIERNEKLNQTISSKLNRTLANFAQISSKIGDNAFTPAIGNFLDFINSSLEGSNQKGGEAIGQKIGQGIFRGLGQFLTGPGILLLTTILGKLVFDLSKFTFTAIKDVLNVNTALQQQQGVVKQVGGALQGQVGTLSLITAATKSRLLQERELLDVIRAQSAARIAGINGRTFNPGLVQGRDTYLAKNFAPFNNVTPAQAAVVNAEMQRILALSQNPNFVPRTGIGSAAAGITRFARGAGITDTVALQQIRDLLASNIRNLRAFNTATAQQAAMATQIAQLQEQEILEMRKRVRDLEMNRAARVLALSGPASAIFGGGAARAELRGISSAAYSQVMNQRAGRIQNGFFMTGAIAPMALGAISDAVGNSDTLAGRRANLVTSAVGDIAGYAGVGGLSGGLGGVGLGAVLGSIIGISRAVQSWNDTLPDLKSNLQTLEETSTRTSEAIRNITILFGQLGEASVAEKKLIESKIHETLGTLPSGSQSRLIKAFRQGGVQGLESESEKIQKEIETNKRINRLGTIIAPARGISIFGQSGITKEGSDVVNELSSTLSSLGFDKILGNNNFRRQFGLPGANPAQLVQQGFNLMGQPEVGKNLSDQISQLSQEEQRRIFLSLFSGAFSLRRVGGKISGTNEVAGAISAQEDVVEKTRQALVARFLSGEDTGTEVKGRVIGANFGGQAAINSLTERQRFAFESQKPFISPIAALQSQLGNQRALITAQALEEQATNARGLAQPLAEFGLEPLQQMALKTGSDLKKSQGFLSFIQGLDPTLKGFREKAVTGELAPEDVVSFATKQRDALLNKTIFREDSKFRDELLKMFDNLIKTAQTASDKDLESAEKAQTELEKISAATATEIELLRMFTQREGVNNLLATGRISGREGASRLTALRAQERLQDDFSARKGITGTIEAFRNEFNYNGRDFFQDLDEATRSTAQNIKGSFSDAFKAFAAGTVNAKDAFRNFALSITTNLTNKGIDFATNMLFSGLSSAGYSLFSGLRGYSQGGLVTGGSGTRDDVPSMLAPGDFVVQKSAVNKYGLGVLASLNNSYEFNNPSRPTAGAFKTDSRLSSFALNDENNPQNQIKFQREAILYNYLRDKAAYDKQKKDSLTAFRRANEQRMYSAYIAAGISLAGAGISYAASGPSGGVGGGTQSGFYTAGQSAKGPGPVAGAMVVGPGTPYTGPLLVHPYATGGPVFGGNTPRDTIPAMLTGGEFIIRAESAKRLGMPFLNQLNQGRFANGGPVGSIGVGSDDLKSSYEKFTAAIDRLVENTSQSKIATSGKTQGLQSNSAGGGTVINSSIVVNLSKEGEPTTSSSTQTSSPGNQKNSQTDGEKAKKFTELLKSVTLQTIIEQKKPGGLLSPV